MRAHDVLREARALIGGRRRELHELAKTTYWFTRAPCVCGCKRVLPDAMDRAHCYRCDRLRVLPPGTWYELHVGKEPALRFGPVQFSVGV